MASAGENVYKKQLRDASRENRDKAGNRPRAAPGQMLNRQSHSDTKRPSSRNRSRSQSIDPNFTSQSVAQKAKKKFKQLQTKKANDKLARLEKMYQELTEIEANQKS